MLGQQVLHTGSASWVRTRTCNSVTRSVRGAGIYDYIPNKFSWGYYILCGDCSDLGSRCPTCDGPRLTCICVLVTLVVSSRRAPPCLAWSSYSTWLGDFAAIFCPIKFFVRSQRWPTRLECRQINQSGVRRCMISSHPSHLGNIQRHTIPSRTNSCVESALGVTGHSLHIVS